MHKKYLLTWTTKYRKPILYGQETYRLRELIREICTNLNVNIIKRSIRKDHILLIVSVPVDITLPVLMRHIKGKSAHMMFSESARIQQVYSLGKNRALWQRSYYAKEYFY